MMLSYETVLAESGLLCCVKELLYVRLPFWSAAQADCTPADVHEMLILWRHREYEMLHAST